MHALSLLTAAVVPLLILLSLKLIPTTWMQDASSLLRSTRRSSQHAFPTDVVNLTHALVRISSVTGFEQEAFEFASSWVKAQNYSVVVQPIPPLAPGCPARSNLLVLHPDTKPSQVRVVLSTHLDTVPESTNQSVHRTDHSKVWGRGSVDAKGQAAAMLIASVIRLRHPLVAVLLVCGEESDHRGMLQANELGFQTISMVNGEPTESKVAIRQKGAIRITVLMTGKSAHSGYPHLGVSAIHNLLDLLQQLRQETCNQDGDTLNVGEIEGGIAANVVADTARASVFWRVVDNTTAIVTQAKRIIERYTGATIQLIRHNDPIEYFVPEISKKVGTTIVAYNTDIPFYKGPTKRLVLFGGGSIFQAHSNNEFIDRNELEQLPHLYEQIAQELLDEMTKGR